MWEEVGASVCGTLIIFDHQYTTTRIFFTIYSFTQADNIKFANLTLPMQSNSLKLFVKIENWPFESLRNTLSIPFFDFLILF